MAPKSATASRSKNASSTSASVIHCTSQQSRFHTETLDTSNEIDLRDISISIGERELIVSSHLRMKHGVRYGLVGRNGSGKSTLLTAIADKLIPGLSPTIRILLLSQIEDSARAATELAVTGVDSTVLEHVVRGDKERLLSMEKFNLLTTAVESTSLRETQEVVLRLQMEERKHELQEARKTAIRRSGTRGKAAREAELKAEANLMDAENRLNQAGQQEPEAGIVEEALQMLQDVQTVLDSLEASMSEARAASILSGLGFSKKMMDLPYTSLSGGWRSRCSLAISLLVQSDVLLLDEPSNFLDLHAIIWLEHFLVSQERTLVLVSHDQEFLSKVVEESIILRHGKLHYFEGTPAAFELNEKKKRRGLMNLQAKLDRKKDHIEKSIQQGIASAKKTGDENRQKMVKSRQKKLDERWGVETSAKGTRFKLNRDFGGYATSRRGAVELEELEPKVKIVLPDAVSLRTIGDLVHFDNVEFRFPKAEQALLSNTTFTVEQGGRVSFIGANGQGKSTIAKLIMGELQPTKGSITRHPMLKIGYFSQHFVEQLTDSEANTTMCSDPITAISYFMDQLTREGETITEVDARTYLGGFGLKGTVPSKVPLRHLSGGQKVRLALALVVYKQPPLLLLDEVTTHVDFATIEALADALRAFSGAIIIITHDRWFSRVVVEGESPRTIALESSNMDISQDSETSSTDDEVEKIKKLGLTYAVGGAKVKLLKGGMVEYVETVERKVARSALK